MFHAPHVLWLLLFMPLLAWWLWKTRAQHAIEFSSTRFADAMESTWRQKLTWLPTALTLLAMSLLILCLAGPRDGRQQTTTSTEGIAIEILVDRSGSMQALDFKIDDTPVDRLTAVKDVAGRFLLGDDELKGRFHDLVGLISFAGFAEVLTPPTLDHRFVVSRMNETQIATSRAEGGTAIGDAIGLAVEKLNALGQRQTQPIKSKIVILLTDGENTAGDLEPLQAAELAKTMQIKVYTIGVGTQGRAPIPVFDPFSGQQRIQWTEVTIDEETLQAIADATGGKYFRATDTQSLEQVYAEIDRLEKTEVETTQFVDYRELAIQPIRFGGRTVWPLAWWAMASLSCGLLLRHTVFREFV